MLEKEILGACLLDTKAADIAITELNKSNFTGESQEIFEVICNLREQGKEADVITVNTILKNAPYLFKLTDNIATTRLIKQHCKDLKKQVLKRDLRTKLIEIVNASEELEPEDIKTRLAELDKEIEVEDIQTEIRDLDLKPYKGIVEVQNKFISTGLPTIDYALNDLVGGLTTLVAGRNNGGKTTFCNQVIANAIDKGHKVLVVNGEEKQEVTVNKLYTAVIGRDEEHFNSIKINRRFKKEPKKETLRALQKWHRGKLKVFSKGESNLKTTDQLFMLMRKELKKSQQDLIVLDNLMSLLTVTSDTEKNGKQAEFMQKCCDMAKENNVHIIVVLHPNKTYRKGDEMESEQIAGTSDLANKADNIITVIREYDEGKIVKGINGYIKVQKNRDYSDLPKAEVYFDPNTGLLLERESETGKVKAYTFKWQQYLNAAPWDD
ncbi:Replicative DNA helicase [Dethiosulfatibacter aminovorans DSM 17477]|uniref:DNA 5'-3' helicase n=1 Tax=Dethiosulfatibacter aminovorans DSM 17477 TaxID=1121476 RepID=A0A1M6LGS3_9FIRM|nr:DnaB-like helicase C-terminal domain-containing protein [Dethiosulfatibacter aminovorans]SHJ70318.1 Replicative DNA helicase [Dethiosulfatibacter aminovorans DSM 17477]